jgi:alanyl-tRNA synthetase
MQIAENDKENLSYIGDTALFITSFYDSDMMRELANFGMTQKELCVILSGDEESGFSYVAGSLSYDLMKFAKNFNSALNGRGGGRGTMIQGKVSAAKQDILNYFNELDLKAI